MSGYTVLTGRVFGTLLALAVGFSASLAQESHFSVGSDPVQIWKNHVDKAKDSILDVTKQLSTKTALNALVAAHKHGVKVRMILDSKSASAEKSLASYAVSSGIEILEWPSDKNGELYGNFTVIDRSEVLAGNFTLSVLSSKSMIEAISMLDDSASVFTAANAFQKLAGQASPWTDKK